MKRFLKRATSFDRAVYWAPKGLSDYNKTLFEPPIQINCRWEEFLTHYVDREGKILISAAKVWTLSDLDFKGVLWHGKLVDLTSTDPKEILEALEIRSIKKAKSFNGKATLFEILL